MTLSKTSDEIFRDLAIAVADALECKETPAPLADALLEIMYPLESALTGDATAYQTCAATLRSLAAMAENGDGRTRPEVETLAVANPERKTAAYTH
jgi:hypothetical protein